MLPIEGLDLGDISFCPAANDAIKAISLKTPAGGI
jgi:hypothetical protein